MNSRLEFKAALNVTDTGEITGIAWPFGSPDSVGDVIEKGAFAFNSRLPMLWAHDQAATIGIWDSITESSDGLQVKGRLLIDDVSKAREVRALVKEGAVTGLSIGFETKAATGRRNGGRTIKSLVLHEISIVSIPAHPGARIQSIKEAKLEDSEDLSLGDVAERVNTLEADITSVKEALGNVEKAATRIETKLARPGIVTEQKAAPADIERKAFGEYLRRGDRADPLNLKALVVATDAQGGYAGRLFAGAEGELEDQQVYDYFRQNYERAPMNALDPSDPFFPVLFRDLVGQGLVAEKVLSGFGKAVTVYVTSPLGRFVLDHIGWQRTEK